MSRGPGRIERTCLSVLVEAEGDEPVVGRTAADIVLVAFGIEDPFAPGGDTNAPWGDKRYHGRYVALSSVHRALRRLIARGVVQENGLSEIYDGRKLYRAPGQRPIHLPDLSKVPPA